MKHFDRRLVLFTVYALGLCGVLAVARWLPDRTLSRTVHDIRLLIDSQYVEEAEGRSLCYGAAKGMVESLDAHSTVFDASAFEHFRGDAEGPPPSCAGAADPRGLPLSVPPRRRYRAVWNQCLKAIFCVWDAASRCDPPAPLLQF